jgi:hypothetical protein
MINVFRVGTAFVILMAASQSGWADPWRLQQYPKEHFQVEWSGPVKVTPTAVTPETKQLLVYATNYMEESGAAAYLVASSEVVNGLNFEEGKKQSFAAMHCKSVTDHPLDLNGIKAAEMVGTNCDNGFHVRGRYFARGKEFYQVIAIVPANGDLSAGDHFVESFKLLDD